MTDGIIAVAVVCVVGLGCYACHKHAKKTHMRNEPCCCETICSKFCCCIKDEGEDKDFCCCEHIGKCCKTQVAADEDIITRQPVGVQIMIEETMIDEGTFPTYNTLPTYSEVSFVKNETATLEIYVIPAPPGYYEVAEVDYVNSN